MKKNALKVLVLVLYLVLAVSILADEEAVYFLQISDTHFGFEANLGKRQQRSHFMKYRDFTRTVNDLKQDIKFMVVTGDVENTAEIPQESFDRHMKYMSEIKYPVYYLPGNHDINPETPDEMTKEYNNYKKNFGDISYAKEFNGVKFIFMYAQTLRKDVKLDGYNALNWLEDELNKNKDEETVIFMHTVPGHGFYQGELYDAWNKENQGKFKTLIEKYDVKAVIGGHTHNANYDYLGDIPMISAPAFMSYDGDAYPYRLYKYEHGKISFYTESIK